MARVTRIAGLFGALALALAPIAGAEAQTRLKFGHVVDVTHAIHLGATAMADHLRACTNGAVQLDIFPNAQLGGEAALLDQTRLGTLDFTNSGAGFLSRSHRPLGLTALPYVFRNRDHARAYVRSDVLPELMEAWNRATGQVLLGPYYAGAFHIFGREGYPNPESLRGRRIRVPDAPAWLVFFRAIGASPVPIPLPDTYLALRQGVVEGTNMPLGVGFSQRLNEVTQVVTMTYHQMEISFLVAGGHVQRLPAAQWRCVQEAGVVYGRVAQDVTIQGEDSLRERATRENLIRFLDPDLAAFQRATSEVIAERVRAGDFPQSLVDRIAAIR